MKFADLLRDPVALRSYVLEEWPHADQLLEDTQFRDVVKELASSLIAMLGDDAGAFMRLGEKYGIDPETPCDEAFDSIAAQLLRETLVANTRRQQGAKAPRRGGKLPPQQELLAEYEELARLGRRPIAELCDRYDADKRSVQRKLQRARLQRGS